MDTSWELLQRFFAPILGSFKHWSHTALGIYPIGSMYGIYANIGGILMVNVIIYSSTMDPMAMGILMYIVM